MSSIVFGCCNNPWSLIIIETDFKRAFILFPNKPVMLMQFCLFVWKSSNCSASIGSQPNFSSLKPCFKTIHKKQISEFIKHYLRHFCHDQNRKIHNSVHTPTHVCEDGIKIIKWGCLTKFSYLTCFRIFNLLIEI